MKKINQKGFSIIEVLIVLAIAGLIMLVVFLAVPALQRNARNQARQSDASKFAAAINQCMANNNGKVSNCDNPADIGTAKGIGWTSGVDGDASQLTGTPVNFADDADATTKSTITVMAFAFGHKCDGSGVSDGTSREFAIVYRTEGNNSPQACINS